MEDKRHPRIQELNFEVPPKIDPDAFLFLGDPEGKTQTLIGRWWLCAGTALMGGAGVVLANVLSKRPAWSAIHKTAFSTIVGGMLGEFFHQQKVEYCAERDLQMFHYVCLHPEDFPEPKRVLYRDYLTWWQPIR